MREEDKNYNLEEDDEDENFMIGGTDDDLDEEPEEPEGPEGEEEAEARVNKKPERKITPNKAADTERVNTKKEKKEIIHDEEEEEDDYDYDDDDDEEENGGKKKIIIIAIIVAAAVAAAGVCTYQKLKGNNEGTHQEQQTAEVTETPTPEADSASEDSDYEEDFGDDSTETDDGADSADADSDSTDEDEDGSTDENDAMPTSTPKPLPTATPIPTDIPNTEEDTDVVDANNETDSTEAENTGDTTVADSDSQSQEPAEVIFLGDERFRTMANYASGQSDLWECSASGDFSWMTDTAYPDVDTKIGNGTKIFISMGINDLDNYQAYASSINTKAKEWQDKGASVYFVAVGPVSAESTTSNQKISTFNTYMYQNLSIPFIDAYNHLVSSGFSTTDGQDYDEATSTELYNYLNSLIGR